MFNSYNTSFTSTEYEENAGFQQSRFQMMNKELVGLKEEHDVLKAFIKELIIDRDRLRLAMRKLKVENGRQKAKLKRIGDSFLTKSGNSVDASELDVDTDYEDVAKDFLLIGGPKDPLDLQYPVVVRDGKNNEFKTGERFMWFKMAETFNDAEVMQKILTASDADVGEIVNKIKDFDQAKWDTVKIGFFEEYQRLKFNQHRDLLCLLIKTGSSYLALAYQDKMYGTGWRKQRTEADRPQMWDGQNLGGKVLMNLRDDFIAKHIWKSTTEEEEAQKSYKEFCQKNIWKRIRPKRRRESSSTKPDPTVMFQGEGYTSFDQSAPEQPKPLFGNRSVLVGGRGGRGRYNRRE